MIERVDVGGTPKAWEDAGFSIGDSAFRAGATPIVLTPGEGVLGWRLAESDTEIDGLPVCSATEMSGAPADHPIGVTQIDHLVVFTPDLERTTEAFEGIGIERRRVREVETDDGLLRQGFFRLGEVTLEVVSHPNVEPGPARFWGITFAVSDLDAAADLLGERLGRAKDAVQPGRRIATMRREAGLGLPVALISDQRARAKADRPARARGAP